MTRHALLALFPHPDDETFSIAGTLARCRARGVPTALWIATDGEAGRDNGERRPPEELARRRRAELLRAAGMLGTDRVRLAGLPDGGLGAVAPDVLAAELRRAVERFRPTVLVTFGPEGAPNQHRDHKALSALVTAFFREHGAALGLRRLYWTTWAPPVPGGPIQVAGAPATCRVDVRVFIELKRRAFDAHATQHHHRAEFELHLTPVEEYALAAGAPQPSAMTDDLFAGL
jgi:LmbE family N-acetylglucosaminyl deacetylase